MIHAKHTWLSPALLAGLLGVMLVSAACGDDAEPVRPVQAPPLAEEAAEPEPSAFPTPEAQVLEAASDLAARLSETEQQGVRAFASAFADLSERWDNFHADYERWRQELTGCDEEAMRRDLRQWASAFGAEVTSQAQRLRPHPAARSAAELASEALSTEEVAIRRLSETWEPGVALAFLEFDRARAEADKQRRQAVFALEQALHPEAAAGEPSSTPDPALGVFAQDFSAVNDVWDAFHRRYDEWRGRGGGCDSSAALATMRIFLQRFQDIAAEARRLPYSSALAPVLELLYQAAETGERALKALRDTWQPYNRSFFVAFEDQKETADRLRRQAATLLVALQVQYGLLPAP